MMPIRVLMVTGAYPPEVSGGGVQCRELVRSLQDNVNFTVLTTCSESSLPEAGELDGVPVYRILVDVRRVVSKLKAAFRLASIFVRLRGRFDIVHLHGFSQKSLLLILLARFFRKKIGLKLSLVGEDDPHSIRRRGRLAFWCYSRSDFFFGVSPRLQQLYHSSYMPQEKFWLIPNGVDLERFRPKARGDRLALRQVLGLPEELFLILFVGLFSHRKCPKLLLEAWMHMQADGLPPTGIVFVGATRSRYWEVDSALAQKIREDAEHLGVEKHVIFIEVTHEIEKYYRAADVFVLPSTREGLPNALLEGMATGLPCVASRLDGVTDVVIEDGVNGLLIPPGDVGALEDALRILLRDPALAQNLGRKARETVQEHYSTRQMASLYLKAYQRLTAMGRWEYEAPSN